MIVMKSVFVLSLVGMCLTSHGQAPKAKAPDRQAAIWNAATDRLTDQMDIWFKAGEFPKTIQVLRLQAEIDPHDYDVATNLGWMYENVDDYPNALIAYKRFRQSNPQDPDAAMPEAEMYYRKRKYADVIPILGPIIGRMGMHPNNYRLLATSYERVGKLKESRATWQAYIKLAPKDEQAKRNLERVEKKLAAQK